MPTVEQALEHAHDMRQTTEQMTPVLLVERDGEIICVASIDFADGERNKALNIIVKAGASFEPTRMTCVMDGWMHRVEAEKIDLDNYEYGDISKMTPGKNVLQSLIVCQIERVDGQLVTRSALWPYHEHEGLLVWEEKHFASEPECKAMTSIWIDALHQGMDPPYRPLREIDELMGGMLSEMPIEVRDRVARSAMKAAGILVHP